MCLLRRTFALALLIAVFGGLAPLPTARAAGPILGTFDETRSTTANSVTGLSGEQRRASLLANYPGYSYASTPELTPSFLAGIDILAITSAKTTAEGITPLSAAEQTAMYNYVLGGGTAFLVAEGFSPFIPAAQSMVEPFGVTIADDGQTGNLAATPLNHTHPVINGPYGDLSSITVLGAGNFTALGSYATSLANMNANNLPVLAVIERNALGPGSGRVVMVSDATLFVDNADGGFFSQHERLYLNTIQYLIPEPDAVVLAVLAAAGVVPLAWMGRRRRRASA